MEGEEITSNTSSVTSNKDTEPLGQSAGEFNLIS